MIALVTGGSGSGKSAWAEGLCAALQPGEKTYIATMDPHGGGARARIARHRAMRAGKGFRTEERPRSLSGLALGGADTALLECMSNLTANVMFSPAPPADCAGRIWGDLEPLMDRCGNLVVVSNEIFSDGVAYDPDTTAYLAALGDLNRRIAARADLVAEIVCGLPIFWKGEDVYAGVLRSAGRGQG